MFLLYSVTARDFLVKDLSAILQKYEQKYCTQGNVNYS